MSEQSVTGALDPRFSQDEAAPPGWPDVEARLEAAELYWITTVRADGRPHTTPLVGVWHDGAFWFCTGRREQKHRNLRASPGVTVTTGTNTWAAGTDLVVEGAAERVTGLGVPRQVRRGLAVRGERGRLRRAGRAGGPADVFRVPPSKVLVFAKSPHGQTSFRF